jgi:hypothetical protein
MSTLHIYLEDGFENDTVVVRVNGREVFRKAGVRTRPEISLADLVEAEVDGGPTTVGVEIPTRGEQVTIHIEDAARTPYVHVSRARAGGITYQARQELLGHA